MVDQLTETLLGPSEEVAPRLLGCELIRDLDGTSIVVKIVETEAYNQTDVASHSFHGETARTKVMFGPPGLLYVYFTYGMHYCCNVVTGPASYGAAVLIRAVEPLSGINVMSQLRRNITDVRISNGPAKLCQALNIDKSLNAHDLRLSPLQLVIKPPLPSSNIVQTTRVGISRGKGVPWRFFIRGNPYVSQL